MITRIAAAPRVALAVFLVTLALDAARASDYPPFVATRHVRTVPEGWVPPAIGADALARLEELLGRMRRPFYAVIVDELPGVGDPDARAQALTDGIAAAWTTEGYDAATSTVFALSFSPRKYSLLVGAKWRAELGLEGAALDPYIDHFIQRARGTPSDPAGGIGALAAALDEEIFDRTDPGRIAERVVAAENAAREEAIGWLGQKIGEGDRALADPTYLPADAERYRARIARARPLLESNDSEAINREARSLDADLAPLYTAIADARAAADRAAMIRGGLTLLAIVLVFVALAFFFVRRAKLRHRRDAFAALADVWGDRIRNAAGRYVEFYGKRDGILGLLELEGKTAQLLNQVTTEVDAIYSSVAAMEAHVKAAQDKAARARWYRLKPIDQALAEIEQPFDFDTGVLNEADLFGPATKMIKIDPGALSAELEARFAASLDGWKQLESAAELRFHEAAALFPQDLLDAQLARAKAWDIPARWLGAHPLFGDDASDKTVWETADGWRWKDAVAYLEAIEQLRGKHDELVGVMDRLVAARESVAAVRLDRLPPLPGGTRFDAPDDPADTIEDARAAEARLEQLIVHVGALDEVEAEARSTVELYRKTAEQVVQIEDSVRRAAPEIDAAQRLQDLAKDRVAAASVEADRVAGIHRNSRAKSMVGVAEKRWRNASIAVSEARQKLTQARHLDAWRLAERAKQAFEEARSEAEQAIAHVDQLEQTRFAYETRLADTERIRAQRQDEVRRWNGDERLLPFEPEPTDPGRGPFDYVALTAALDAALESWVASVRRAKAAWEAAERRRREAEEAARAARIREAARRSHSWSSSSSSSSSRSFSSFSSSSRSSSSSSSRSGSWGGGGSSSRSGSW